MRVVRNLISWRQSFRRLSEEYETANKKKKALDSLLADQRISQTTYDLFDREIAEATAEIEKQQRLLQEKMDARMGELGDQVKTLEILLANFELQHVTGEIEEDVYQRQIAVLSVGLESAKQELERIRESSDQLLKGDLTMPEREPAKAVVEPVVEFVPAAQTEAPPPEHEEPKETMQGTAETKGEAEEKQEA